MCGFVHVSVFRLLHRPYTHVDLLAFSKVVFWSYRNLQGSAERNLGSSSYVESCSVDPFRPCQGDLPLTALISGALESNAVHVTCGATCSPDSVNSREIGGF